MKWRRTSNAEKRTAQSAGASDGFAREIHHHQGIVDRTEGATDEASLRERAVALWVLGDYLYRDNRYEDSLAPLEEASSLFAQLPSFGVGVVSARVRLAHALVALKRGHDAVEMLDAAIGLREAVPEAPDLMPSAFALRMFVLKELRRNEDAFRAAEALIEEFATAEGSVEQRRFVVEALILQGELSRQDGDANRALEKFDEAIQRCSLETSGALNDRQAEAIALRASVVEDAGQA